MAMTQAKKDAAFGRIQGCAGYVAFEAAFDAFEVANDANGMDAATTALKGTSDGLLGTCLDQAGIPG